MKKLFIKNIPQDTDWNRSFNVLVPLEIQGKECQLIEKEKSPTPRSGSIAARVKVGDKFYSVPGWAYEERKDFLDDSVVFES